MISQDSLTKIVGRGKVSHEAKILEATAGIKEAEEKRLPDAGVSGAYLYLPVQPHINLKSDSSSGGGG